MAAFHKIAVALIVALSCACGVTKGDPDVTLLYNICNGDTLTTWAYNELVNSLLQDVVDKTPSSDYNYYNEKEAFLVTSCFGHGLCNGVLTPPDCNACLSNAKRLIQSLCRGSVGAQVQLQDCRIRYEKDRFNEG